MRINAYTMTASLVAVSLVSGCVSPGFRAAVGKFGAETQSSMKDQADQTAKISKLETNRLRYDIAQRKIRIGLHEDCSKIDPDANGMFVDCKLVDADSKSLLDFGYNLPDIVALQSALSNYGRNLAELASPATDDKKAFAASVSNLASSIGKLDEAVSKTAKTQRIGSSGKIDEIAGILATLGNLALEAKRQHALKRIIISTDPIVSEAMDLIRTADLEMNKYRRLTAINEIYSARNSSNTANNLNERRASNDQLFEAVIKMNQISSTTKRLRQLAAVHSALAAVARKNNKNNSTVLARRMLASWTSDQ